MARKTQNVRFDYYLLQSENGDLLQSEDEDLSQSEDEAQQLNPCDITQLLIDIKKLKIENREKINFGVPVRMDLIHQKIFDKYGNLELTYFHMVKLRSETLAVTKKYTEELKDLEIASDDYIAEDIGCVFDPSLAILMVQRNFYSLSVSGIREYLLEMYKSIYPDKDVPKFIFTPVPNKEVVNRIKRVSKYRKLTLGFASGTIDNSKSKVLKSYLGPFESFFTKSGGTRLELVVSAGGKNEDDLNLETMKEMASEIIADNSLFSKAIFRGKEGDAPVEAYDLLNGKYSNYAEFSTNKEGKNIHLKPVSVEDKMYDLYLRDDNRSKVIHNLN